MIQAHGEISIERTPEEAFDFVADLRNEPQFNPDARNIVKVTDGPIGQDTVYTEDVKPLGAFEVRIDRYERPGLLGFDAKNARADILIRFHFTPEGDGTRLRAELEMRPKGAIRLAEPLLRPMVRRTFERKRGPMIKQALERR